MLDDAAAHYVRTSLGFDGPHDADTPLQAAAREAGWALMENVDRFPWERRQQVSDICAKLAKSVDGLVWPWQGDDPRHDQIRDAWKSFADEHADDDGKIDLSDVDTCVAIGCMKAFQLASTTDTPPSAGLDPGLIAELRGEPGDCPFCGADPYHYVDNGVGWSASL